MNLVSSIDAPDFGADTVRIGDMNGDGAPDLLFVQSEYATREIRCLTAATISGERLWQTGEPSPANGRVYSDLPVQIYDWDNDGVNEVLYIRQAKYAERYPGDPAAYRERARRYEGTATMVVLNGVTGQEKLSFPIPAPADDCFAFTDLTGHGRREDFVIKDRAENVYGVSRSGELLWHWHGGPWPVPEHNCPHDPRVSTSDPDCEPGHFPAIGDVDDDGRDEVFFGFVLLDHDGRVLFRKDTGGAGHHSDANAMVRLADGSWRLLFGNHGVHCLAPDGREIWHQKMDEAQHVVVGRFSQETAMQAAVINRGMPRNEKGVADLHLFDIATGRQLWKRTEPAGSWGANCQDIRWTGSDGLLDILVGGRGSGRPAVIYNGKGDIVEELEIPQEYCGTYDSGGAGGNNTGVHYCCRADVFGDSREEVIIAGCKGLRVYANAKPLAIPNLYNNTRYLGM